MDKRTDLQKELDAYVFEYCSLESGSEKQKKRLDLNNFFGENINYFTESVIAGNRGNSYFVKYIFSKSIPMEDAVCEYMAITWMAFDSALEHFDTTKGAFSSYFFIAAKNNIVSDLKEKEKSDSHETSMLVYDKEKKEEINLIDEQVAKNPEQKDDYSRADDKMVNEDFYSYLSDYLWLLDEFHKTLDTTKKSNEIKFKYFKTFYTAKNIELIKDNGIVVFKVFEGKVFSSINISFLDYVVTAEPRTIAEIEDNPMKKYKDLARLEVSEKKSEQEIKLPIESKVVAAFYDVTKANVSKLYKQYLEIVHFYIGNKA